MHIPIFRQVMLVLLMACFVAPIHGDNAWIPLEIDPGYSISSFLFVENFGPDTVWAIGEVNSSTQYLIRSTDGGGNWENIETFNDVHAVDFVTPEIGFISSWISISKTTDGGESWTTVSNFACNDLLAITPSVIWTVGDVVGGVPQIHKSDDGGDTWELVTIPNIGDIDIIEAIDTENLWLGRSSNTIALQPFLKTTDGGGTWTELSMPSYLDFSLVSETTAYSISRAYDGNDTYQHVYKTIDGGDNWTALVETNLSSPSILAMDAENVWAVGNHWDQSIFRTSNGGESWDEVLYYESTPPNDVYDICAFDTDLAWLVSDVLYKYTTNPEVELIYPDGGEVIGTGSIIPISWSAAGVSFVDLYYKTDADDWQWILIEDSVSAALGQYYWEVPDVISETCEIRVQNSNQFYDNAEDVSASYFSIADLPVQYVSLDLYDDVTFSELNTGNCFARETPIRLRVRVQNNQDQNLLTASGILRSTDPHITIIDSVATFNNILAGQNEISADEFEFTISADAPDEFVPQFQIAISDEIISGGPWVSSFFLPIIIDPFSVGLVVIDDDNNPDSQGDNDDIAEPGETIEIIPLLTNTSENEYDELTGELNTIADYISIWDGETGASGLVYANYPYNVVGGSQETVTAGQTGIMPEQDFVFTYSGAEAYSIPLYLLVSAEVPKYNGMEMRWQAPFELNAGQPVNLVVSITAPADASEYEVGQVISIHADAAGVYGVLRVEFTHGETLLSVDVEAPYEAELNTSDLQPGSYAITAEVWDSAGHWATDVIEYTLVTPTATADMGLPTVYRLANHPNPFNPSTTISYDLPEPSEVTLIVHNITGRTIRTLKNTHQPAGRYSAQWNGTDDSGNPVSTGVYFARLQARGFSKTIKMVYLK